MQESDGSMRQLTDEETNLNPELLLHNKVLQEGRYFKIKHCFFKIAQITSEGIEAKGVSRREYFENRNRRKS